jgi:hypothetical protein
MHPFYLHFEFYKKPIFLIEEKLANPLFVIKQFFDDNQLNEVMKHLQSLLVVVITSSYDLYIEVKVDDGI